MNLANKQDITLMRYILLPTEISEVELKHVHKINKIALGFCLFHLPVFLLVSYLCNTSMTQALVFGSMLFLGPLVASYTLENPRTLSLVYGFTSMCLGALLVHLGQGPVQIEMHFHFFASLALLSVWGNPLIIWVAAITVAAHHGLFWLYLPQSVFNYDASFWVVGVHSIFVIVESIAASYIARNFYDNVIGLDKIVKMRTMELESKNNELNLILDNTIQGFLMVNKNGEIFEQKSSIIAQWFGHTILKQKLWDYLSAHNKDFSELTQLGFEDLVDEIMPLEFCLESLPKRLTTKDSTFDISYKPIPHKNGETIFFVVVTNITEKLAHDREVMAQMEIIEIFELINQDRLGFNEYIADSKLMIDSLVNDHCHLSKIQMARSIHTLKGNSAVFKVGSLAHVCNEIESRLNENDGELDDKDKYLLKATWENLIVRLDGFLHNNSNLIEIECCELSHLIELVKSNLSHLEIADTLNSWKHEPVKKRLQRISNQAQRLAQRLDKGTLNIECKDNNLRIENKSLTGLWSVLTHVIRNSIDHGIEDIDERALNGKEKRGKLVLETKMENDDLVVSISDDGRGINIDQLREVALKRGLNIHNNEEDVNLIFEDGITTKQKVTEVSGRGIGLSAVRKFCDNEGIDIHLESQLGQGTMIAFRIPKNQTINRFVA